MSSQHVFSRLTVSSAALACALSLSLSTAQAQGGSIKGTVKFAGKLPPAADLNMKSDPYCAKKTAKDETVVADAKGNLKNVIVRVAKGFTGKAAPATGDVVLDQNGCNYQPRVSVALAGQSVAIKNSDQTLHNIHTYKGPATMFNQAQPQGFPAIKKTFKTGDVIRFKCDVHPWMTAWVAVVDNALFAISGADGSFSIDNVPPGKYTVEAWHEKFGTKTAEIEVKAGAPAAFNVEFK